jgi:hypothetical protein
MLNAGSRPELKSLPDRSHETHETGSVWVPYLQVPRPPLAVTFPLRPVLERRVVAAGGMGALGHSFIGRHPDLNVGEEMFWTGSRKSGWHDEKNGADIFVVLFW